MARSGNLRERAVFSRLPDGYDDYGEVSGTPTELASVWADLREQLGKEALAAGRLEGSAMGTLRVRDSAVMRGVRIDDQVTVRGRTWNIVSLPVRVGRSRELLEFRVEVGGAV